LNIKYAPQLMMAGALVLALATPLQSMAQPNRLAANAPVAQSAATASGPNTLDYTSSWLGNSLPGNGSSPDARRAVPIDADSIYATPDGKVFTNTTWDEGGRVVSIFKDGKLISPLNDLGDSKTGRRAAVTRLRPIRSTFTRAIRREERTAARASRF